MLKKNNVDYRQFYNKNGFTDEKAYIAHGSGVNDFVYTNSYEGVLDSIQRGFTFIELDLLETSDNVIIGGHDWVSFKKLVQYSDESETPLSYSEIKSMKIKGKYTVLAGKDICAIMEEYPDFYLVTDKIRDYALLLKQVPFPERLIVEVFSFEDYYNALLAGIKFSVLYVPPSAELFAAVLKYKIPMITGSSFWLFDKPHALNYYNLLHKKGVAIFLYHHLNNAQEPYFMKEYMGKTFSKFYVDKDYKEIIQENMQ